VTPAWRTEEASFTTAVVELFRMSGWLVHHDRGEMRKHIQGDVGFPDIFAVNLRTKRAIAAELKMPKGTLSDYQVAWITALMETVDTYVWRPENWDAIVKVATSK
jgi:hypothetical protein